MASIAAAAEHSLGPGSSARAFGSYASYASRGTRRWKRAAGEGRALARVLQLRPHLLGQIT